MTNHTDQPDASATTPMARDDLVEVTVPVPAAHLASFFQTVGAWYEEEAVDDAGRGRMTIG
jgi:hypothetical protein